MVTKKEKRRMYRLHANLRRKGNAVVVKQRMVTKRAMIVSSIELKWINELIAFDYCFSMTFLHQPFRDIEL